jgi:hypothetical protein
MKPKPIAQIHFKFMKYLMIFALLFGLQSCKKDKDDYNIELMASFEAEINGEYIKLVETGPMTETDSMVSWILARNTYMSIGLWDYVVDIWQINLGKTYILDTPLKNNIAVNFVNHFSNEEFGENGDFTQDEFERILRKGTKDFTSDYTQFPGVIIEWSDAEGITWTSGKIFLSGDTIPNTVNNDDGSFVINYSVPQSELYDPDTYAQYLDLSFQCKLYNMNGDMITLKNGKMKSLYIISLD